MIALRRDSDHDRMVVGAFGDTRAVDNDPELMRFNTWRAERPEYEDKIVSSRNDHCRRAVTVRWAGEAGDDLRRLRDEARHRNIELVVQVARYTPSDLFAAAHSIFDAKDDLASVGFDLYGVSTDPEPEGLLIAGSDASNPDGEDDDPLAAELVRAVRELVADLDGIRETFAVDDIRVEPGRIYPL